MSRKVSVVGSLIVALVVVRGASAGDAGSGVEIEAKVVGRMIAWHVTNRATSPIVRIEVPAFNVYDHVVPAGWSFEQTRDVLHAWSSGPAAAIRPGGFAEFRVTGTSSSCKPGLAAASFTLADDRVIQVPNVISFEPESRASRMIPPAVICGLVLVHLLVRRRRHPA